ncbi:DNRLRE domain-containing protein [Kribbella sp. NPDC051137]|uniref:DNRLRE domain-containing protein n=1 Tax=Kribbella sp. NPDC051137 TaxID=3155045 RepID=UPI002F51A8BE
MRQIRKFVLAGAGLSLMLTGWSTPAGAGPAGPAHTPAPVVARSPEAQARATGQRVEVTRERSETSTVYANPDGTYTAELSPTPVRVRQGGGWAPVDNGLVTRADGSVGPKAAGTPLRFSGGGSEPLVTYGENARRIVLRWPGKLPKPVLSGATATYPEVFPGVDLQVSATTAGFSQVLVVKSRQAARNPALRRVGFGLSTSGLSAKVGPTGITAYDRSGKAVLGSGAAAMWDSAGARSQSRMTLANGRLVLEPDRRLLTGSATKYPVYVDPPWGTTTSGFVMVFSGHPNDTYYGGDGDRIAKVGDCAWDYCNGIGIARSYFQFNASALKGKHIISAELNAFENYAPSCSARNVELWWTSSQVSNTTTWNNQPFGRGTNIHLGTRTVAYGYSSACPGNWVGYDAVEAVKHGVSQGGITTFMLKAQNESDALAWKKFTILPSLSVVYNSYPGTPAAPTAEGKSCGTAPNEAYVNPYVDNDPAKGLRGPRLATKVTDADGGNLRVKFEWSNRSHTVLGTATTASLSSGSTFTADVPASLAADGAKLSYRAIGDDGTDVGPWSAYCDVTIDRTAPTGDPSVASSTYPECLGADCPAGGGIGQAGTFTFDAGGDADAVGFRYGLDNDQTPLSVPAGAAGGTATVQVTPTANGPMDLYVRTVDRAGNLGTVLHRYHFYVG